VGVRVRFAKGEPVKYRSDGARRDTIWRARVWGLATIHGVTVTGATTGGIYVQDATATISDSVIWQSGIGLTRRVLLR
jgi:hypothetical protein